MQTSSLAPRGTPRRVALSSLVLGVALALAAPRIVAAQSPRPSERPLTRETYDAALSALEAFDERMLLLSEEHAELAEQRKGFRTSVERWERLRKRDPKDPDLIDSWWRLSERRDALEERAATMRDRIQALKKELDGLEGKLGR